MTVYVDNMRRRAQLTGRPANWSHMFADTHAELMAMASEMGLRPEWLQHPGTHREHFDVTDTKRTQALGLGAVAVTYPHDTGRIMTAKRKAVAALNPGLNNEADMAGTENG
jgi:hypothetical protein